MRSCRRSDTNEPMSDDLLNRLRSELGAAKTASPTGRVRALVGLSVRAALPGVRALDGLVTLAEGQRIGLFAGSGVGKSTLLGAITRGTTADAVVVALVGERGREVREFLDHALGEEGQKKSAVVVATSDASA